MTSDQPFGTILLKHIRKLTSAGKAKRRKVCSGADVKESSNTITKKKYEEDRLIKKRNQRYTIQFSIYEDEEHDFSGDQSNSNDDVEWESPMNYKN